MIADGAKTLGEGFHHVRGGPHAEREALSDAERRGNAVAGATLYVTLEPCDHTGLTPPCSSAVIAAGITRVVVGVLDPNPRTAAGGVARLRAAGVSVDVVDDAWSIRALESFATAIVKRRPHLRLKLAASLDGFVAPSSGERHWLTGYESRAYVRDLRASCDAVLVGAGTVRTDDPELTVRPPYARRKPYRRVVACETAPVPAGRRIFAPVAGYAPTIVLAPAGARAAFAPLEDVAEIVYVGDERSATLDLESALERLYGLGISSVLCEGGPTLGARFLQRGLVDRFDWLVAPTFLAGPEAVRVLGDGATGTELQFDNVERLGADVLLSGVPLGGAQCSAA